MKQLLLLVAYATALAACQMPRVSFSRMSEVEIAAYNASVDTWEQVHCVEETRIGSHIPRRHCMTLREIQEGNANEVGMLNAMSVGTTGLSTF